MTRLLLWLLATAAGAQPTLEAAPAGPDGVVVDGRLDDAAWLSARAGDGFTERVPAPGAAPPVRTEVRALFDGEAVYVAVTCHLLPGESPRGLTMTRDSFDLFADDAVTLKFDVHRDRRTTIGLAVNPVGAQLDYISVGVERFGFRTEFDAVWEAATQVTADRWVVEYRVPYVALGLSAGDGLLGFQVTRDHAARTATYDWSPMPPEFGPVSAPHYGTLAGPRSAGSGSPIAVVPFLLGEAEAGRLDQRWGADVRARLAEDVWGELTLFTDFAEVDLDEAQVNLDRFPLFFPEKRPFFLAGLEVFEVGRQGIAQPFFSRRIGFSGTEEVPVFGGAKIYGRSGPVAFGLLDVVTDEADATNALVGRARLDSGPLRVGLAGTHRAPLGDDPDPVVDYGWVLDASARGAGDRFEVSGYYAGALQDADALTVGHAGELASRWRGEVWQPEVSAGLVQEDYQPALGFVRRPGTLRYAATSLWEFRLPDTWLWSLSPVVEGVAHADAEDPGDREGVELEAGADARLAGGYRLEGRALWHEDEVDAPFRLAEAFRVPAGTWRGFGASARAATPGTRDPQLEVGYEWREGLFGGTRHQIDGGGRVSFGPWVRVQAGALFADVDLPRCLPLEVEGEPAPCEVSTVAVNASLTAAATPRLVTTVATTWETVEDVVLALARLRWRYAPGSDLILVWRERIDAEVGGREYRATLKLAHRFDGLL